VLEQLQQLQLQHAQLQKRFEQNNAWQYCKRCKKRHPRGKCHAKDGRNVTRSGPFEHTVGTSEASTIEVSGSEVCVAEGGIPLGICADSGATNVVTPDRAAISNYKPFPADQGQIRLADKSVCSRAERYGNLTLRSKSTGSLLTFTNVLYMSSARRTLVCLGKSMRSEVY
jgi:hypothetical protein